MNLRTIHHVSVFAVLAGATVAQGTLFPTTHSYPAVNAPYGSTLVDLNADGILDYLVANYFTDKVTVLLGTGTGTFNAQPPVTVGGQPRSLACADLNGDTKPDLVTANSSNDQVAVLLGTGTGTFGAATLFAAGSFPVWVDVGDLDGDGDIDVVTGDQSTNTLSVMLGDGAGALAAPSTQIVGFSPERIRLADVNGDGDLDCVTASWLDERVCINLGDGAGNLNASDDQYSPNPKGLAVGDVDGDGRPDVAVVSSDYNFASVFRTSPTGALGAPKNYYWGSSLGYATAVVLADVSADGRLDLIALSASAKTLTVLVNIGGGDFGLAHTSSIADSSCYEAIAADLNGDGFADVVTSSLANNIRVHLCAGVGSWERYCTAKTNSLGCVPQIWATGTPSVSNVRPFSVYVTDVLDNKLGLFIYTVNGAQASTPFQGGTLCLVASAIRRTPAHNSGTDPKFSSPNCEGSYGLNFNAFAQGLAGGSPAAGLTVLGNNYQLQLWSRDPGFAPPNNSGLSPALEVTPWL